MAGTNDCNNDQGYIQNWDNDTVLYGNQTPQQDMSVSGNYCGQPFGSPHSSGFNVVFCDGHVSFISSVIDLTTWQHLAWIADDNPVPDF